MKHTLDFKAYNEGMMKGKLLGLRCRQCNSVTAPPKMACQECGGIELDVEELSKQGEIVTFSVVNVGPEGRENEAPYIIVLVQLNEGPWLMGNLIEIEPAKATMDLIGKTRESRVQDLSGRQVRPRQPGKTGFQLRLKKAGAGRFEAAPTDRSTTIRDGILRRSGAVFFQEIV